MVHVLISKFRVMTSVQPIILCFLYGWFLLFVQISLARDIYTLNYGVKIIEDESIVSKGKIFEMGFFSPVNSSGRTYLGIWYYQVFPQTIVWVANRDTPIEAGKGVLQIAEDGNLVVTNTHGTIHYWSSKITGSSSENRTARLNDWGNLELLENEDVLWESFDHPTDTFLAGMTMKLNLEFTCWNNSQDPATGNYKFKLDENKDRFTILEGKSETYWESESLQSETKFHWMFNASRNIVNYTRGNKSSTLEPHSRSVDSRGQRLVMNSSGNIQVFKFDNESRQWNMDWAEPSDKCKIYNHCGNFKSCSIFQNEAPLCKCLPGFKENEKKGCVRESTLSPCVRQDMAFLNLMMMEVGDPDIKINASTEEQCQSKCFEMCPKCQAYSYLAPYSYLASIDRDYPCLIWTKDLVHLQEQTGQDNGGHNLSVMVKRSDIVGNGRSCEPCGTNIIPYPLSTGPNCGDPMYSNFTCNNLNGQLSFKMAEETFQVTQFFPNRSSFIAIATNDSYNCDANHEEDHLYHVTCHNEKQIEVEWEPPLEPACSNSTDCIDWPHSTCETRGTRSMCLCLPNYHWNGSTLTCMKEEPPTGNLPLILTLALISMIFLVCTSIFAYFWRVRKARKQDTGSVRGIQESLYDSVRHVKGLIGLGELEGQDNEGIGVPFFNFETILAATENFSDANKLGRGGYGPVYKGRFLGGQDIAVKRLSSVSKQGLQEFKNEVVLIAKLQHRNLVRLRGYSIKEDEKVLLYEYMPNKSLDLFLFDRTQTVLLDWNLRFDIILGIARGLLYLHQDSRLRIIHRDLKTSNILLDEEMNPKISDFGLAKIFGGKETEASTERIVGTYGYMAPEYALDGMFSVKSDVFSFGVVLLEIISGKKNTGFYQSNKTSSLLGYAWRLWTENNLMDLMDSCLRGNYNSNQFVKCANIGLLCVQDEPSDRPTMSNILMMLESEITTLPIPQQPTFFVRSSSNTASSSSKAESKLQIETSYLQGR